MFSKVEQRILLELLQHERLNKDWHPKSKPAQFYNTMSLLKDNDLITIEPNGRSKNKAYILTVFGRCMASFIAKHTRTEPKNKQYAYIVDMYIVGVEHGKK